MNYKKISLFLLTSNVALFLVLITFLTNKAGFKQSFYNLVSSISIIPSPLHYEQELDKFDHLPLPHNKKVFLGDSLVELGKWDELFHFSNVNRGISGLTVDGLIHLPYLQKIPSDNTIILLIGINDLWRGQKISRISENISSLVKILKKRNFTKIYWISILPTFHPQIKPRARDIVRLKGIIKDHCLKNHFHFIDLYSDLVNEQELARQYSKDGVHLNGLGYQKLKEKLELEI